MQLLENVRTRSSFKSPHKGMRKLPPRHGARLSGCRVWLKVPEASGIQFEIEVGVVRAYRELRKTARKAAHGAQSIVTSEPYIRARDQRGWKARNYCR